MAYGGLGKVRNPWGVIGLSLITIGIYFIYWQYVTYKELKDSTNDGIGGGLGLVFAIFIPIVNSFMLPSEVGHAYQRQGKAPPVTGVTGFWTFIPFVGFFIWTIKVQGRLNEFWESGGLSAVGAAPPPPAPTGWSPPPPPTAAAEASGPSPFPGPDGPPQAPFPSQGGPAEPPPAPSGDVPPAPPGDVPPAPPGEMPPPQP